MAEPDSLSVEEVQRRRAAAAPDSLSIEEVQERLRGPKFGEAPIGHVGADILSTALESTGRRALDSFSLGFGDEIIAGAQAAFGTDYEEALAESEPQTQAAPNKTVRFVETQKSTTWRHSTTTLFKYFPHLIIILPHNFP